VLNKHYKHCNRVYIYGESLCIVEYYILNNGNSVNTVRVYNIMLIQFVYPTTYKLRCLPDLPTSVRTLLYITANLIELRRKTALLYLYY